MRKFIIKNCPFHELDEWEGLSSHRCTKDYKECKEVDDCLLKQILQACNNSYCYKHKLKKCADEDVCDLTLAKEIIQLLDVQTEQD